MKSKKTRLKINNMENLNCESNLEMSIRKIDGVVNVFANHYDKFVTIEYNNKICNSHKLRSSIAGLGYNVKGRNAARITTFLIVVLLFTIFKLITA